MNRSLLLLLAIVVAAVVAGLLLSGIFAPRPGPLPDRRDAGTRIDGDLAAVPDLPPGIVTGSVVAALTDRPIEGALVRTTYFGARGAVDFRTLTLADGTFRLEGVPPWDAYRVTAFLESYALGHLDDVRVRSRETVELEPIRLERPVRLEGIVLDVLERPIEGAVVAARPSRDLMLEVDWLTSLRNITTEEKPLEEVKTDEHGRFALVSLAAGRYNVRVMARGFTPGLARDVLVAPGPQREPLRIVLGRGKRFEGIVVTGQGDPVAGAAVALDELMGFAGAFQGRWTTTTGADGRFVFGSVAAGQYVLAVRSEGHPVLVRAPLRLPFSGQLKIRLAGSATLVGKVKDPAGKGIPAAQVMVVTGPIGWSYEIAETSEDGSYRVEHLPSGQLLFVSVTRDGYVSHPEGPLGGRGIPGVSLVAGEETRFDISLRHGARIVGKVTTSKGDPIPGAIVRVLSGQTSFLNPTQVTTQPDGTYRYEGVGVGRSIVIARAPGFYQPLDPRALGSIFSRRAMTEGAEAAVVEVKPDDEEVELDLVLRAACIVEGRVLDPDGEPVAGARVKVASPDWMRFVPGRFDLTGGADVQTVSDEDGRYRLAGVNAGESVRMEATSSGFAPGISGELRLQPGDEKRDIELRLGPGGLISGVVMGASGEPVADALVRVAPAGQEWSLVWGAGDPDPVRTDGLGKFEKAVFGTDPVSVRVDAEGYVSHTVEKVEVVPGETSGGIEVLLTPALAIAGQVLGPDGSPLPDAFLRARAEGGSRRRGFEDLSTHSDATGLFRIEGIGPGKYTLITQSSVAPEQRTEGVDAGREDIVVTLPPGRRIAGRVVGPAGEAVAFVTLRARRTGGGGSARVETDQQGGFVFENLAEGKWSIEYRPDARDPGSYLEAKVSGVESGSQTVVLTLAYGAEMEGMVLDPTGSPARGVSVILTNKSDRRSTMTGSDGTFRIGGLPEKAWTLTATGGGGAAGRLEDVPSASRDVVLRLETSLAITGRVLTSKSRPPVVPLYVAAAPEGSDRPIAFVTTDTDGTFAFSGLAPGKYRITTEDSETGETAQADVAAGTAGVTLKLKKVE